MAQQRNLAAIDIGSNAIRMVIAERTHHEMKILKKFRFPIRLGADVFEKGKISGKNLKEAARTFGQFQELCREYHVRRLKAVGTSALREATNQKQFVELIRRKSSIHIEVIDGVEEAKLIHLAVKNELDLDLHQALLIDIGGGSMEVSFSENSLMTATQSFPFGTVRTLELMKKRKASEGQMSSVMSEYVNPLNHFLASQPGIKKLEFAVGTGGNLETIGKLKPLLLGRNAKTFLSLDELNQIIEIILKTPQKERIAKWNIRPDRADVILPAALVVQLVLQKAGVTKMLIPYVGLKDGLLWDLVK